MAEQIIQEIYSQVQSKKKILATPPQEDAPSVDIANIRMPTPPSYKVGDKVPGWLFCEWTGTGVGLLASLASHGLRQDVPSGGCEDECGLRARAPCLLPDGGVMKPVEAQRGQGTYLRLHSKLLVEMIVEIRTFS
jgi:hypothetical protein